MERPELGTPRRRDAAPRRASLAERARNTVCRAQQCERLAPRRAPPCRTRICITTISFNNVSLLENT
eukprot:5205881-Pleurochrysis_carterae.AAC.1